MASETFARIALDLMPGKTRAASTPMIMTTIMSSTMVNPAWRYLRISPPRPQAPSQTTRGQITH
jgi:hypothetical protein